jgi:5-methylcytosine-specific restriction endonuclease McrA
MPMLVLDVEDRVRIDSGDALLQFLDDCITSNRKLYVWNCKDNQSPTKIPEVTTMETMESKSSTSRNSAVSTKAKTRDKYTCLLCGYKKINNNDKEVQACHILEKKHFDPLSDEEKEQLLTRLRLSDIESKPNLITFCTACHNKFDSYDFVFHPVHHGIEMTGKLLELPEVPEYLTGAGTSFKSLNGKVIVFNGGTNVSPPFELKQYRYEFLGRVESRKKSQKVEITKKTRKRKHGG